MKRYIHIKDGSFYWDVFDIVERQIVWVDASMNRRGARRVASQMNKRSARQDRVGARSPSGSDTTPVVGHEVGR